MSENNDVVYQIKENYIWLMYELESILGKTTNHDIYKMCYMFRYLLINGFLTKHDINFDSTDESFTEGYYVFSKHNNYVCALNMLKDILDIVTYCSKTIFMIAEESQVKTISEAVNKVTGGLQNPNTGIMFCTPVVYIEGLRKNKE